MPLSLPIMLRWPGTASRPACPPPQGGGSRRVCSSRIVIAPPPSAARSRDGAHASPRSRARRRHPRIADRPWAAARRSSGGSAPSRRGRRRRWSSSPGSGAYSATMTPAFAGTSSAMPRACPSFKVAVASRLTKVASTAASSGRNSSTMRASPSWIVTSRSASEQLLVGLDRAAGHDRSAGCPRRRSGPSRCGGGPDRCRGCESPGHAHACVRVP